MYSLMLDAPMLSMGCAAAKPPHRTMVSKIRNSLRSVS
jgi:hypothetical protein